MSPLRPTLRLLLASAVTALLGGCVIAGDVRYPAMAPVVPVVAPSAPATAGAIYASGPGLQLYSDRRARDVGDLLTITLTESTTAQTTANTSTDKESNLALGTPTLFGAPVTGRQGHRCQRDRLARLHRQGHQRAEQPPAGQRDRDCDAAPAERQPVAGRQEPAAEPGDELVQVQGIVRAADIFPDNTIPSSRVADARIVYGGRGPVAQSNAMGWLSRFFNSALVPF